MPSHCLSTSICGEHIVSSPPSWSKMGTGHDISLQLLSLLLQWSCLRWLRQRRHSTWLWSTLVAVSCYGVLLYPPTMHTCTYMYMLYKYHDPTCLCVLCTCMVVLIQLNNVLQKWCTHNEHCQENFLCSKEGAIGIWHYTRGESSCHSTHCCDYWIVIQ